MNPYIQGFTPAHAGNTFPAVKQLFCHQVHPRSRGEYGCCSGVKRYLLGSPPLTRGIRTETKPVHGILRFTPAHAGNTCYLRKRRIVRKVHPRSRGEYGEMKANDTNRRGSPPLTRGILLAFALTASSLRFTPAHAGNTYYASVSGIEGEVHPRSRGEYRSEYAYIIGYLGSPPLTRGIPAISESEES